MRVLRIIARHVFTNCGLPNSVSIAKTCQKWKPWLVASFSAIGHPNPFSDGKVMSDLVSVPGGGPPPVGQSLTTRTFPFNHLEDIRQNGNGIRYHFSPNGICVLRNVMVSNVSERCGVFSRSKTRQKCVKNGALAILLVVLRNHSTMFSSSGSRKMFFWTKSGHFVW